MVDVRAVGELLSYVIGGGWGSESPTAVESTRVGIIRGADFPRVEANETRGLPIRFEAPDRVKKRTLIPGDIVLEISGGTKDRPTGRAVFIRDRLLRQVTETVIPASFCRLLRPDTEKVAPEYLYYWLRDMYASGRTWAYQVQSTGIANFQIEMFKERELVRVPPLVEQRRIAGVLRAFDDLIDTNTQLADQMDCLLSASVQDALDRAEESEPLSTYADFVNGRNFTKGADGTGRPVIRTPEVRLGPSGSTPRSSIDAVDANVARSGDTLFVWSGSLTLGRWRWEDGLVNQHVFKVIPRAGLPDWLPHQLIQRQLPWFLSLAADKATTMGHIQRRHLDALVPALESSVLSRLDEIAGPLWAASLDARIEADRLAGVRDELLPLLMSGRVTVDEVLEAAS